MSSACWPGTTNMRTRALTLPYRYGVDHGGTDPARTVTASECKVSLTQCLAHPSAARQALQLRSCLLQLSAAQARSKTIEHMASTAPPRPPPPPPPPSAPPPPPAPVSSRAPTRTRVVTPTVVHRSVEINSVRIRVIEQDITDSTTSAVVNAANTHSFTPIDSGVSGALRDACAAESTCGQVHCQNACQSHEHAHAVHTTVPDCEDTRTKETSPRRHMTMVR